MTRADEDLLSAAYHGRLDAVQRALAAGADIEAADPDTGLTALHLAVGRSHLDIVQFLIEGAGAAIKPDGFGRWPTVIAGECQSSQQVCDYIVEREAEVVGSASHDVGRARDIDYDEPDS